jgi:cysteine desulfurase
VTWRVAASAGSACHAHDVRLSPVLRAMGIDPDRGRGTLRLSVGRYTSEAEVDEAAAVIIAAVRQLGAAGGPGDRVGARDERPEGG